MTKETQVKRRKYLVQVENQTKAKMVVFANSKEEAFKIANRDMNDSFNRQLEAYVRNPNPMIRDLTGSGWALKSGIQVIKE